MKKRFLFTILIPLLYGGCSFSSYGLENNKLVLNDKKNEIKIVDLYLKKEKLEYNFDPCVLESFQIKDNFDKFGDLYIESIYLDSDCSWKGFAGSYWEQLFRAKENINTSKVLERFDIGYYEFSQHQINNKYKVNFIYLWGVLDSLIIIDTKGAFTNHLLKKLSSKKQLPIQKNEVLEFGGNYSLVEDNWYKQYFSKEGSSSIELFY